jgi:hypothetical protein
MPLTLPFFLTNTVPEDEAKMATLVFIENSYETSRSQEQTAPGFAYTAWQFLNPSSGSSEAFEYVSQLSVTARIVTAAAKEDARNTPSPAELYIPSARRTVFPGQRWQVCVEPVSRTGRTRSLLKLDHAGTAPGTAVEIVSPLSLETDLSLELHWYFGASRMGVTTGIAQGQTASMQAGSRLFFKPVIPGKENWLDRQWTADEVQKNTTSYTPPIQAEKIQVLFCVKREDPTRQSDSDAPAENADPAGSGRVYEFNPPGG